MKDFLQMDVCVEDKRICADEPMDLEEYAALMQLLEKFSNKCGSIGEALRVSEVMDMVIVAAAREVK